MLETIDLIVSLHFQPKGALENALKGHANTIRLIHNQQVVPLEQGMVKKFTVALESVMYHIDKLEQVQRRATKISLLVYLFIYVSNLYSCPSHKTNYSGQHTRSYNY